MDKTLSEMNRVLSVDVRAISDLVAQLPHSLEPLSNPVYEYLGSRQSVGGPVCVQRHCSAELAGCLADDMCRRNFGCAAACDPTDSTCTFMCSESYQSPSIDRIMHCMFEEYDCIPWPEPSPENNVTCREPIDEVV